LSDLTAPLSASHRVIVDKHAGFLSLDEVCCGPGGASREERNPARSAD